MTSGTITAHPADIYTHTISVTISQADLKIEWIVKPGPLLTNFLWNEMDRNQDNALDQIEVEAWADAHTALFTASLDDKPLPLLIDSVQLPTSLRGFQAGEEFITFHLSAVWPQVMNNTSQLTLENGMEQKKSINVRRRFLKRRGFARVILW